MDTITSTTCQHGVAVRLCAPCHAGRQSHAKLAAADQARADGRLDEAERLEAEAVQLYNASLDNDFMNA